jgi:hypothetical protein
MASSLGRLSRCVVAKSTTPTKRVFSSQHRVFVLEILGRGARVVAATNAPKASSGPDVPVRVAFVRYVLADGVEPTHANAEQVEDSMNLCRYDRVAVLHLFTVPRRAVPGTGPAPPVLNWYWLASLRASVMLRGSQHVVGFAPGPERSLRRSRPGTTAPTTN